MKYNRQLDGLRCVAISLVMMQHFAYNTFHRFLLGYYGVELFFVLSGFLITSILLGTKQPFGTSYKNFIGRRALRIFPIYYLMIFVLYIAGHERVNSDLPYLLTYTYNYAISYWKIPMSSVFHLWSLSVEEQFYLLWPFLVIGLRKETGLLLLLVSMLVAVCLAQLCFNLFPEMIAYNYMGIFPRAASLGIGAIGAILYKNRYLPYRSLEHKGVEALAFVLLATFLVVPTPLRFFICPLLSLFFVLKTTHKGFAFAAINRFLLHPKVAYVGAISYGIYLFHVPVAEHAGQYIFEPYIWKNIPFKSLGPMKKIEFYPELIKLPFYALLSIFLGHLSYQYLERPVLSLKDKWFHYRKEKKNIRQPVPV